MIGKTGSESIEKRKEMEIMADCEFHMEMIDGMMKALDVHSIEIEIYLVESNVFICCFLGEDILQYQIETLITLQGFQSNQLAL
jgi:hypothetical protein